MLISRNHQNGIGNSSGSYIRGPACTEFLDGFRVRSLRYDSQQYLRQGFIIQHDSLLVYIYRKNPSSCLSCALAAFHAMSVATVVVVSLASSSVPGASAV